MTTTTFDRPNKEQQPERVGEENAYDAVLGGEFEHEYDAVIDDAESILVDDTEEVPF